MSLDKTVEKIDFLLNVVNEADKGDNSCCNEKTQKSDECCGVDKKNTCCNDAPSQENVKYFQSSSEVKNGMNVRVTADPKLLGKFWDESHLGPMEEIESLCNVVGNIQEVEESDNTVELRWENYDTAWIPLKACSDAGDTKPTLPGLQTSWLSPDNDENKEDEENNEEEQEEEAQNENEIKYFQSVEDVKIGDNVRVTKDYDLLEKHWQTSELEPNDSKYNFLGIEGAVEKTDENYDTIEIRWTSSESVRLPVQACHRIVQNSAF